MKKIMIGAAAMLLVSACNGGDGAGNSSGAAGGGGAVAAVPAPNGQKWSDVVSQSPDGGFVMGNPNAPVKLVEFASMTCGHCANFARTGLPELERDYIESGRVSLELRNYLLSAPDLAASLLTRCNGAAPFFKLTDQMFAQQEEWLGRLQTMSPAQQQQLQTMPPQQQAVAMAEQAGLIDFVRVRGVPEAKARQCLADQPQIERLVQMTQRVTQEYPNFRGTPSFLINGELVENASDWAALEPKLQAALN